MPSKANKRAAAAAKSAAKAATEGSVPAAQDAVPAPEAPVAAPVAPTPAPVAAPAPVASAPAPEAPVAAPEAPTPTATPSRTPREEKKPLPALDPPPKLIPFENNPQRQTNVITNSYPADILNLLLELFRYDAAVTRNFDDPSERSTLTGTKGGDRKRQGDCTAVVRIAMARLCPRAHYFYDGGAMIFMLKALAPMYIEIRCEDLPADVRRAHFSKHPGYFSVEISLNRKPNLVVGDILTERLDEMESGDKSVTCALQVALAHEAKEKGFLIFNNGNQLFMPKATPTARKGIEERDGIGAGVKVAAGKDGKGQVQLVLELKKGQMFTEGPLSNLQVDFRDRQKASRFLRGLKLGTTYSAQTFQFERLSAEPLGDMKTEATEEKPAEPLVNLSAKIANKRVNQYNLTWPALGRTFRDFEKNTLKTFYFPIENMRVLAGQRLGPQHGEPPRCPQPRVRYEATKFVGEQANILSPNKLLEACGFKVNPEPITVRATQIAIPTPVYKGGQEVRPLLEKKASWMIGRNNFVVPMTVAKVIMAYHSSSSGYAAGEIMLAMKMKLVEQSGRLGMRVTEWAIEDLSRTVPSAPSVADAIVARLSAISKSPPASRPYFMFFDDLSSPTHDVLKMNERRFEVLTQHVNFGRSATDRPGVHTVNNLLLKMNTKLGGLNHQIKTAGTSIPTLWGQTSETLIISYDVCHSSGGGSSDEPSVVGFAYNVHKNPEIVTGDFHYQRSRQEQVDSDILTSRAYQIIEAFYASRGKMPANIIVLRDGVSEGQYRMVKHCEVTAIDQGIAKFLTAKNEKRRPKVAVVIATKRHANRLFVRSNGRIENAPPMIAIDSTIVRQHANEVLFVSHCPLGGTAQPLLLNVIRNEGVFRSNEQLVTLIASLCTAHQSSMNVISLPEPIQAADEYAKRGADLFAVFKRWMAGQSRELARTDEGNLDLEALTRQLSYSTSIFKHRRMV